MDISSAPSRIFSLFFRLLWVTTQANSPTADFLNGWVVQNWYGGNKWLLYAFVLKGFVVSCSNPSWGCFRPKDDVRLALIG
jgi:hypothetical protein